MSMNANQFFPLQPTFNVAKTEEEFRIPSEGGDMFPGVQCPKTLNSPGRWVHTPVEWEE